MKNLPIGLQFLSEFAETNRIYVDKTRLVHQLVTTGKYYFLSRPRRFGKSLLVSTLRELFEGNKILFKDLWIEPNWDWSQKNPVVHLSFAEWDFEDLDLAATILKTLNRIAHEKGILLNQKTPKSCLRELLHAVYQQAGQVVLLIDEYDKPLIHYLERNQLKKAIAHRKFFKNFYSGLKDAGPILRLIFITGVSKFSKTSVLSNLNHLSDLTFCENYAALTGYTQQELEYYFKDHLKVVENELDMNREQLLQQIKRWYGGYTWDGKTQLYNPFGVLAFLQKRVFQNYCFEKSTLTFLLKQMKKYGQFTIENIKVNYNFFEKYDLENIEVYQLLFQMGYLTIQKRNPLTDEFWLDIPNQEVHDSLYPFLLKSGK
jgi:Predicted AAA-ATPase